ncbi:MAG: Rrf2 family transcriptional regulator [Candidatus Omnitrophica bacterium]|nr:Rrf2 family transcriptional regulator [Candidatus Omnitrophota bacterium]MDE2008837.1 Rrf2 family transcriptional regulator [Candidatus Omnitrophota bacterium]MDE2213600.1 Rrf2 family transcriptional regulator [Candidatus Omnitrophota bacterium]MDE2230499.1 Rrf2 family transcriptional regulator [Candidatus Omnitrophota bacterium]
MISKTSLLTIKALLELSRLPLGQTEGVGSIAKKIQAPQNYLGKVLQRLAAEGIVVSKKGLKGGFRLSKDPSQMNLYNIVDILEDVKEWEDCFMGKKPCSESTPCCAHKRWDIVRRAYADFLKNTTIADLQRS